MSANLGKSIEGRAVMLDVERLVASRMLVTANSGGGKSWLLRRLLEQTHGTIQQLVLDPEGEFYTLREKLDFVLAGKGGDCPAEPRSAPLLARKLLELGTSAIIDLSELAPRERVRFVRLFLEALVDAPRELWRPALVVLDEAHAFAPESGHGEAESTEAVGRLMSQGRKRGFAGVLATQRLSKLAKDVAAEANNLLIGRAALDVDVRRAGSALGMSARDASSTLPHLKPGHFFAFGPAVSQEVVELVVGPVESVHPQAGQRARPPAPPRDKVRKVLGQLADLPAEAEAEHRTVEELRARVRELERELAAAKRAQPEPKVERIEVPMLTERENESIETLRQLVQLTHENTERSLRETTKCVAESLAEITAAVRARVPRAAPDRPRSVIAPVTARNGHPPAPARRSTAPYAPAQGLNGPEQRILDSLAWWESVGIDQPSRVQVAVIARYSPTGGAFQNPLGALRTKGLVEYPSAGSVALTAEGRALAHPPDAPATSGELHARLQGILNGPQWRILSPLIDSYPAALSRADVAAAAGYEANGGAFQNPLGSLRSLGLIDYPAPGQVAARPVLFLEAVALGR